MLESLRENVTVYCMGVQQLAQNAKHFCSNAAHSINSIVSLVNEVNQK